MPTDEPGEMGLHDTRMNDLTPQCLSLIFSHLDPVGLGAASCVQKLWRDHICHEDSLWRAICASRLGMESGPVGLAGQPLPTYREAFTAWHQAVGKYGVLAERAYRAWRKIERWTAEHIPQVAASLREGATEEALDRTEAELGYRLPPALRVLYRLHDGQDLRFDAMLDAQRATMHASIFHGLFGGYSFYSHLVSCRMLPLRRMVRWTKHIRERLGMAHDRLLFAANFNFNKAVYCCSGDAQVKIASVDKRRCLNAVPPPVAGATGPEAADGVLRWFEAYAAALELGRFAVEPLDPETPDSRAITLFPQLSPWRAEAITRGVRVRALPVFVPELTQISGEEGEGGEEAEGGANENQYFFAYSVRYALLPGDEQVEHWPATAGPFRPLSSVQLRSRHWLIRDGRGNVESEVRGEAVVGQYPLLTAGGPEFAYASCTHQRETVGSMEGDFKFVEGTLQQPQGPEFDAACAPFRLDVPEIIF